MRWGFEPREGDVRPDLGHGARGSRPEGLLFAALFGEVAIGAVANQVVAVGRRCQAGGTLGTGRQSNVVVGVAVSAAAPRSLKNHVRA